MHEDEAAIEIANALCGKGVGWSGAPREGKLSLKATCDGLLKVDVDALLSFNMFGDVMCATRHTHTIVQHGREVAATRAIPLVVSRRVVNSAVVAARTAPAGVVSVKPMIKAKAGVMITGNEVYSERIQDKFQPIIREKVAELGGEVLDLVFLPDDDQQIATAATDLVAQGANLLISTGGMSVDPDDRSRYALQKAGARDMVYGSPVLPGAMFMVAYLNDVPVLGIPACGMYAARTVLDIVLPRVLADEKITRTEIAKLGHGGLCLKCKPCTFPVCPFGKQ
jgi:molybdopterin biosynthesis enzyme